MDLQRRGFLNQATTMTLLAAGFTGRPTSAQTENTTLPPPDANTLTLNRATFGITASLVHQVERLGRDRWLQRQLNWQNIDDSWVEEQLHEHTPTIFMSEQELMKLEKAFLAANQLKQATLFRALYSPRQLYEVMVEFWSNHFNIYHRDGPENLLKTIDDREVIRPHALGRFRDLLHASSKSPAMLYYLDNHTNVAGTANENYARELMELHTLGVDGGYTETDVKEVARCFTGWALERPGSPRTGKFRFYPNRHDDGAKHVLGMDIPAGGGIRDGEQVIERLASHPSTARFIAFKLARHFVSDTPPDSLVERLGQLFLDTDGDIAALLEEIFRSREFLDSADLKIRRPITYLISALRATTPAVGRGGYGALRDFLYALGQIPFNWVPPDGYPDTAGYWTSTNGMLNRWNFASALASSRLPGIRPDYQGLAGKARTPEELVDRLTRELLHRPLAPAHRNAFITFLAQGEAANRPLDPSDMEERFPSLLGLMLSSPYFQYA